MIKKITKKKEEKISDSPNSLGKDINSIILPQLWVNNWTDGSLTLVRQPVEEKENSKYKPVVDLERDGLSQAIPAKTSYINSAPTVESDHGTSDQ